MQNLEILDVFEILITQKLLKCPKDPFVRSALIYIDSKTDYNTNLNLAIEPYDPSLSAASTTPSVHFRPRTDVPVTVGYL